MYRYLDKAKHTSTPPGGFVQVLREHFWCVHPEKGLVIYVGPTGRFFSPQCNEREDLAEGLRPEGTEVQLLSFVWLPHDCADYA